MNVSELGRLEPVDLREAWQREDGDFTPWLAEPDNIKLLGDTLGLDLDVETTEAGVGSLRADIVCRDASDASDESLVLIENQLERTNHVHLGQLLTYAAGLDAVTVVWIAASFTDDHRAALDWLNQKTEQGVNFFGLEIELWKIGESATAPKFNVVAKPNDWNASIRGVTAQGRDLSETKRQQLEFWTKFKECLESRDDRIRFQTPKPQHWMNYSLGRSGMVFSSVISTLTPPSVRVQLNLGGDNAKDWFSSLEAEKDSIEAEINEELIWHNPQNKKGASIRVEKELDFRSPSQRQEAIEWLYEQLKKFHEVLKPRALELTSLEPPEPSEEEVES